MMSNPWRYIYVLLLEVILSTIITGCNNGLPGTMPFFASNMTPTIAKLITKTPTLHPTATPTMDTVTPTPFSTEPAKCESEIIKIPDFAFLGWWSGDSRFLYIINNFGKWREFDLQSHSITNSLVDEPTSTLIPHWASEIISPPDGSLTGEFYSPSGHQAIIIIAISLDPTLTQDPQGAENELLNYRHNVYIVDSTRKPVYLGEFDGRYYSFHFWFPDERSAIIGAQGLDKNWHTFLVDLRNLTITSYLPPNSSVISISPGGKWLLLRKDNQNILRNLENKEEQFIPFDWLVSSALWWDGDNQFYFIGPDKEGSNVADKAVYRYTALNNQVEKVTTKSFRWATFAEKSAILSPDYHMLAFQVDTNNSLPEVHIINLCLPNSDH